LLSLEEESLLKLARYIKRGIERGKTSVELARVNGLSDR